MHITVIKYKIKYKIAKERWYLKNLPCFLVAEELFVRCLSEVTF